MFTWKKQQVEWSISRAASASIYIYIKALPPPSQPLSKSLQLLPCAKFKLWGNEISPDCSGAGLLFLPPPSLNTQARNLGLGTQLLENLSLPSEIISFATVGTFNAKS